MATIFKPTWTRVDAASGKRLRQRNAKWHVRYRDADGVLRPVPGYKDKEATRQLAAQLEKRAALQAVGVVDRFAEHRKRPLAEHIDDFKESLSAKGNTKPYVDLTTARVLRVLEECGFGRLGELDAPKVSAWLNAQRQAGLSLQSLNFYIAAVKSFCRWLVRSQRLAESPLAHLGGFNVRTDRRHDRRALTSEEFQRLLDATCFGETLLGVTPEDRAMLYLVAANTSLRASELRSLTQTSFDFKGKPHTVTVEAGYSKHRRRDVLPLREDLVEALQKWIAERRVLSLQPSTEPLWPGVWHKKAAEMVRGDLANAKIDYKDDVGRVFDFHAFRHQFLSSLAPSGAHPKATQSLARHSTITLTMDRYAHLGLVDMKRALDALPKLASPTVQENAARATGTDGRREDLLALPLARPADFSCPALSLADQQDCAAATSAAFAQLGPTKKLRAAQEALPSAAHMEAAPGFEPGYNGFANRCDESTTPFATNNF